MDGVLAGAGWLGENEMVELNEEFQGLMDEMDESGLSWGIWAVGGFFILKWPEID